MKRVRVASFVLLGLIVLSGGSSGAWGVNPPKTGDKCTTPVGKPGIYTVCTSAAKSITWACCIPGHGFCVGENGYPHGTALCKP